jgi:phosphocarrier protein
MLIRLEGARKGNDGPRRSRRRARGGPQIYLGRKRDPWRGSGLSCSRTIEITNRRGLHARASAKFVTMAAELPAKVEVEKDGNRVCGTSIMGLMMLGAPWAIRSRFIATAKGAAKRSTSFSALVTGAFRGRLTSAGKPGACRAGR